MDRKTFVSVSSPGLCLVGEEVVPVWGREAGVAPEAGHQPGEDPGQVLHALDSRHRVDHLVDVSLLPEIEK